MKKILFCLFLGMGAAAQAAPSLPADEPAATFAGPDGRLQVTVGTERGVPVYSIAYDGTTFVEKSALGLLTDMGDFTQGLTMAAPLPARRIDETYRLPNIKQSTVRYEATEGICPFVQDSDTLFDVIFRVSNRDVAFRYRLRQRGDTRCCVVRAEKTSFVLPSGTTTFLCPQSLPMGGFARTSPSYETPYSADQPVGQNGWGEGYTFPCLFRIGDKGWALVSETGVNGSYCGSRLTGNVDGSYSIGFPQEGECNGNGTVSPGMALPGHTPWRTVTVGRTLAPVVETTVPYDLVEPQYEASRTFTYGRGSWSWIIGMDENTTYETQKQYIDFSAAMGYESVLIDSYWDTQIGRDSIASLARYAAGKQVGLFLWYNSNGYWNDAPQTPRGIMNNSILRRREMRWLQSIGIRGIKVDFFGGDKQMVMQLYEDILADANDFGLMVIFHGCTLPRGWERMYPNFVASEAVLASENLHFSQGSCDAEAFNATMHPFLRNAVAVMDFGGSALNKWYNTANDSTMWGGRRVTSDVFALATAVLFQSPVQHFALAPGNLTDAPEWAVAFMKEVPSTWDEVRFIDGYPGQYVVLARRRADRWYVAGVNARQQPVSLKLPLSMLPAGSEVRVYADDARLNGSLKTVKISKRQELSVTIPCNGGVLIVN